MGLGTPRRIVKKGESSFKKWLLAMPLHLLPCSNLSPCLLPVILSPCILPNTFTTRLFSTPLKSRRKASH
ncbi:hypothetical protein [Escherichia phage pEC-N1203-2Af.1]|nr:hypothetical protein [Escherichia phage pEC-N1203-2Af.1]